MAHLYILGQPGTGTHTVLRDNTLSAINDGHGVFYYDPTGTDTEYYLDRIPVSRRKDVVVFDPMNTEYVVAWNPFYDVSDPIYIAGTLADAIKDAWHYGDLTTPDMDLYLNFTLIPLITANRTLLDFLRFLSDTSFRNDVLAHLDNQVIIDHWKEYSDMTEKERRAETKSTKNKVKLLLADTRIRRVLNYGRPSFTLPAVLEGKILFLKLPRAKLGLSRTSLIASILLSQAHQAAINRTSIAPFHFILPECQHLAKSVVKEMLTEVDQHNCSITATNQYIDQLPPDYFAALMGNAKDKLIFRTSEADALTLSRSIPHSNNAIAFNVLADNQARIFPVDPRKLQVTIDHKDWPAFPKSREDIEAYHRHNIARKA